MIHNARIIFSAALLGLAACGSGEPDKASPLAALDAIAVDNIKAHVRYLADDALEGRMTGEPGYDAAAKYVADQFAAFGLAPGGVDGWYQPVPLQSYMVDVDSTVLTVHRDGVDTSLTYRDDFSMGGDKVREATSVTAEVVYLGYGVHAPEFGYYDYDGVDVSGKIIATFSGGPASLPGDELAYFSSSEITSREAVARGVVGSLNLRSRHSQANTPWERIAKSTGTKPGMTWIDSDGTVDGYYPELLGSASISAEVATALFAGTPISFEAALDTVEASTPASVPLGFSVTMSRRTEHERLQSSNVIGVVRGSDPALAGEYVIYTAHLDHNGRGVEVDGDDLYNGMYDNAMGSAIMIETARAIAKAPRRSPRDLC